MNFYINIYELMGYKNVKNRILKFSLRPSNIVILNLWSQNKLMKVVSDVIKS